MNNYCILYLFLIKLIIYITRKQLHEIKDNLQKNFSEGTNYFQVCCLYYVIINIFITFLNNSNILLMK